MQIHGYVGSQSLTQSDILWFGASRKLLAPHPSEVLSASLGITFKYYKVNVGGGGGGG